MKLKLWGTRGSLPRTVDNGSLKGLVGNLVKSAESQGITSLSDFADAVRNDRLGSPMTFGGQTTCSEVSHSGTSVYIDMGTGITDAGQFAMTEGRTEFEVFLTHMHWDHLMGMPFFVPVYIPGSKVTIYHVHANAPEYVRLLFNGVNFPVRWDQLPSEIRFEQIKLYETQQVGALTVTPFALDHPGGSFGYRFDAGGKSVLIGVDGEYKRLTPKELGRDLPFYQNLDVMLFDAQYEMDELASRFDWGHCSPPIGVDLALREGIRNLLLTHHDPRSDDDKGRRMADDARKHMKVQLPAFQDRWDAMGQSDGPNIYPAYDGLEFDLDKL